MKRENARLAHAASRLEDDAKRHKETAARFESDLAATRAALRKAEEEFAQRLARDRRAWEQAAASRGEYVEFDPYGDRGDRDGRPKRPPKGGRDENEAERRGDDPATIPLGDSPKRRDATDREMRPAGMSSAHLERVAMREKNKYAQRQRDLAMGVRAEYLVEDGIVQFEKCLSRSSHCFINRANGDVLKAASWKAPEKKNPRGNIFGADPLRGVTAYGTVYLRG